jgi:hypothetical protein
MFGDAEAILVPIRFRRVRSAHCPEHGWIPMRKLKIRSAGIPGGVRRTRVCPDCNREIWRCDSYSRYVPSEVTESPLTVAPRSSS